MSAVPAQGVAVSGGRVEVRYFPGHAGKETMSSVADSTIDAESSAFLFMLASELSSGKIDLPSFPEVARRVRQALQDSEVTAEKLTRIIGSEPALASRILQLANSASFNTGGNRITNLRLAIARIGINLVRSTSISFSMSQLEKAEGLVKIRKPLHALWQHSAKVAAIGTVLARRRTKVSPDSAALAGILHSVGKLYILVRSVEYPALFSNAAAYAEIEQLWHANIAKGVLESWDTEEQIVDAVHLQEDTEYSPDGDVDLTDVIVVANILASRGASTQQLEALLPKVVPARRMQLDAVAITQLMTDSRVEIEALRGALGG